MTEVQIEDLLFAAAAISNALWAIATALIIYVGVRISETAGKK